MALNNTKPARDMGYQNVLYIGARVVFGDGGKTIKVGTLPAGAMILKALSGVTVNTVFNAGTTNTLDIGISGAGTQYASALALGTAAFVALNQTTSQRLAADTEITATVNLAGTAATTGSADIVVVYIPRLS